MSKPVGYMLIVKPSERMYGVFKNANAAATWAIKNFSDMTVWTIVPIAAPDGDEK